MNIIHINFEKPEQKRHILGISMTKTSTHKGLKVYTNLAKLSHDEFFYEMLRSAISLEKEGRIQDSLLS